MEFETTIDGSKAVLQLSGKLTVSASPELSALIERLPTEVRDLDIVLSGVDYVSSAGLRVLVRADKLIVRRGGCMRLLHPCDDVWGVFEMTGLADVLAVER